MAHIKLSHSRAFLLRAYASNMARHLALDGYLLVAHKINAGIDNLDEFVDRWLAERFAFCFSKDAKIGRQDTTGRDGHFMAFQCNPNMLESG